MNPYPLHEAVLCADLPLTKALLQAGLPLNELDAQGNAPLHWAVFGGYEDIVRALLAAGADPNIFSSDGMTPAWRAADFGLHSIRDLLASYGGRVDTNEQFDRNAFRLFNELLGLLLPQEEKPHGAFSQLAIIFQTHEKLSWLLNRVQQTLKIKHSK